MQPSRELSERDYEYGFVTDIEIRIGRRPGLNEDVVRLHLGEEERAGVAARLAAQGAPPLARDGASEAEPSWANVDVSRRSTTRRSSTTRRRSSSAKLDEPRRGRSRSCCAPTRSSASRCSSRSGSRASRSTPCSTSVSVATTFKTKLEKHGIIFCSFSEAVQNHPELVRKYLGSVVPYSDNFFATLNSAVFTDGSFVYVPKGVRCPMELSTYFRINAAKTGQFERTLIIADEGAYVSAISRAARRRMRDENQLHAAVVELVALDDATIKYSTVQNWYPGDKNGRGGIYNFVTKRGACRGQALEDLLDPGRDRLGDHLEVPELHPAGRRLGRRVLLGRADEQPPAGRHRHQDDPHRQQHAQHDRLEGHLGGPRPAGLPRPGARSARAPTARATTRSATRC